MERYSVISEKNPREIVLLRGSGCVYRKCSFCDYYLDSCPDAAANFALNREVLSRVTGAFGQLEVINSGSVFELDGETLALLERLCGEKDIRTLHFESHWLYRERISRLRARFSPVELKLKLGLETFDFALREGMLRKGIPQEDPAALARGFDEANLLFGLPGQTAESMERDMALGLRYFQRLCVNLFCPNGTPLRPDPAAVKAFMERIYPAYRENPRVDILIQNTDFGVGD